MKKKFPLFTRFKELSKKVLTASVLSLVLLVLTGSFMSKPVKAISVNETKISGSNAFIHIDFEDGYWAEADPNGYGYYTIDGQVGFCAEPNDFTKSNGYQTQAFESDWVREYLSKISYYGWDLSGKPYRDYILTQNLIWDVLINELHISVYTGGQWRQYKSGWITSSYNGEDLSTNSPAYLNWKADIMAKVNGSVAFDQTSFTLKVGESATATDQNGMLQYMYLRANSANVDVAHNGNSVTITAKADSTDGEIRFRKTSQTYDDNSQSTLFYKGTSGQDLVTLKMTDPARASLNVTVLKEDHIWIKKVNPNGEPIPGTVFRLSLNPDFSGNSWTYTTRADGWADADIWNMIGQTVYIREESVPSPYVKSDEIKSVVLVGGQSHEITFVNQYKPDWLRVLKVDKNNKAIPGVVFEFAYNTDFTGETWDYVTGQDGYTKLDKWNAIGKTVYIREKSVPSPYVKSDEIKSITLVGDKTHEVKFVNETTHHRIVKKSLNTDEVLPGATIQLIHKASGNVLLEWESTDQPQEFTNLTVGETYVIKEITAPEGYFLAEPIEFTVENTASPIDHVLYNEFKPGIQTTATVNGEKEVHALEKVTLVDKVEYKDLLVGKEYQVKGQLVRKDNQEVIAEAELIFTPQDKDGFVELSFEFDARQLAGQEVVAFEKVYKDNVEVATHTDINDLGQTVKVVNPNIKTTATTDKEGKEVSPLPKVTVTDKVEYKDLLVGKEYQIKGQLVRKDNQEVIAEAELVFTPQEKDGFVELSFEFDASQLQGQQLVVFEKVYQGTVEVASHADLNDEGQTVRVIEPGIKTKASTTKRNPNDLTKVTIKDKVSFKDLVVGKEYQVKGILMDQATGQPFLDNGLEVTSEITFVATTKDGFVEIPFTINANSLKKGKVVVFEDLYQDGVKLYSHADLSDLEQTVTFTEIKIRKVDSVDKTKVLKNAEFTLYLDGQPIQTVVTNENGIATFVVENGDYELKETKAPEGYKLSKDVIKVSITGEEVNNVFEVTAQNTLLPSILVNTGTEDSTIYTLAGLGVGATGLVILLSLRRKKEQA